MTMCVAIGTRKFTAVVADRKLTALGREWDGNAGKCGSVYFRDGSFQYAYSGLARFGDFETRRWLATALVDAARDGALAIQSLYRLASAATDKIRSMKRLSPSDARLSILLVGFTAESSGPVIVLISNFQSFASSDETAWPRFGIKVLDEGFPSVAASIGSGSFLPEEIRDLRRIVEGDAQPRTVMRRTVDHMRAAVLRDPGRSIGRDFVTVYNPPLSTGAPAFDYYASYPSQYIPFPDYVMSRWDDCGAFVLLGNEFWNADDLKLDPEYLRVPPAHKNDPCLCGSGKRYRECHYELGEFHARSVVGKVFSGEFAIAKHPVEGIDLMRRIENGVAVEVFRLGGRGGGRTDLWRTTVGYQEEVGLTLASDEN